MSITTRRTPAWPQKIVTRRTGGVWILAGFYLAVATVMRLVLLAQAAGEVDWNGSLLAVFGWGFVFDLGAALLVAAPFAVLAAVLPAGFFERSWARALAHFGLILSLAVMIFGGVAEWFFWDEFGARFNFIAVDYLVYTQEVISNIRESYPMPLILTGIVLVAAGLYALFLRTGLTDAWLESPPEKAGRRWRSCALWICASVAAGWFLNINQIPAFPNTYNRELAKDGLWSFVAAFRNNELDYHQFYPTLPDSNVFPALRAKLAQDGSIPLPPESAHDTLRYIRSPGPELHPNIIQITVESLSADFLGAYNPDSKLTPELDALVKKSLVFDNFFATGTRTVRGMEALTLSVPPTPGRSIVKRENNGGLFTLGSILRTRDYDTAFIYGGHGYFDNMNAFFGSNGYRIIDRASVQDSEVSFSNAWGACDGDLFNWTLNEADADAAAGKPFHFFLMTTSNHRPYTFPDGKIDLPSKTSGRRGAVKYTDYAIGQFIRDASSKPWFKNTIFVIVADHCASSAGRIELPVARYHIPLIIYSPGGQIAPGHVSDIAGQIDFAPTLLGLLNWSYATRFYGRDVTRPGGDRLALIGNYQKLGLLENNTLTVLKPVRKTAAYTVDMENLTQTPVDITTDRSGVADAIVYYQSVSTLYRERDYKAIDTEGQAAAAASAKNTPALIP